MAKCPNCNQENPDGSKFCGNCGGKLEVLVPCPACGNRVQYGMKFCPECGNSMTGGSAGKGTGNMSFKDNVVSGDVNISNNTTVDNSSVVNNYINQINQINESEKVLRCHVCGKMVAQGSGSLFTCTSCGNHFCSDHMDREFDLCRDCSREARSKREKEAARLYDLGLSAYNSRNYSAAIGYFKEAAAKKNANAMLRLGDCYANGQGAPQDASLAEKWYRDAAMAGSDLAEARLQKLRESAGIEKYKRMLRNHMYDEPLSYFKSAIADGASNPDVYYYACICLMQGKKAFVQQRATIDTIVNYMNTAISKNAKGIYYYFLAYIKYDYFERKYLNSSPDWRTCLRLAASRGATEAEAREMYAILGVERPACL